MPVEGHGDAARVSLRGRLDGAAHDFLVAEVHPVEEPHGDDRLPGGQRQCGQAPDDVHRRWSVPVSPRPG